MALFDVVFEGGGAKGVAFAGALAVFFAQGHKFRRLIGTSAGAITAALLAAGYTPDELLAVIDERQNGKSRFAGFLDRPQAADFTEKEIAGSETVQALHAIHVPLIADRVLLGLLLRVPLYAQLFCFTECGGLFAGANFTQWLEAKLAAKGVKAGDTLATMFAAKGVDLSVVASDTTGGEMLVLNHRTAPGLPVAQAVRMSMTIPFIWKEVVWREEWGLYQGRVKTNNVIVDGGVLSSFPIGLIDRSAPEIMGDTDPNGALNLGLLLDEEIAVAEAPSPRPPTPLGQLRAVARVTRLLDTMMGAADNDSIRRHAAEICRLPVRGFSSLEFDMSDARRTALMAAARAAMLAHLQSRSLGG